MKDNMKIEYDERDDRYIKYVINEDKKVIVCIMEAEIDSPTVGKLILQTRGIARCLPEDKFDIEKGKIIARDKADIKYHEAKIFDYKKVIQILESRINEFNEQIKKHETKVSNINSHLEKHTK